VRAAGARGGVIVSTTSHVRNCVKFAFVASLVGCSPATPSSGGATPASPTTAATDSKSSTADAGAERCINGGGVVEVDECCPTAGEFPDTCAVGTCTCSPSTLVKVRLCRCPDGQCFDGTKCRAQ